MAPTTSVDAGLEIAQRTIGAHCTLATADLRANGLGQGARRPALRRGVLGHGLPLARRRTPWSLGRDGGRSPSPRRGEPVHTRRRTMAADLRRDHDAAAHTAGAEEHWWAEVERSLALWPSATGASGHAAAVRAAPWMTTSSPGQGRLRRGRRPDPVGRLRKMSTPMRHLLRGIAEWAPPSPRPAC